jgi:hypothetical protein
VIDLNEIQETIDLFMTTHDTTFYTVSKLADMFTVMDHLKALKEEELTTRQMSGSEFLEACSGVPYPALMRVLDEHMSALAVVQPREYESLMSRIRALR